MTALVRPVTPADEEFLWVALFHASHSADQDGRTPGDLKSDPHLARYAAGWGRPGDLGVLHEESGHPLGAAWLRLPVGDDRLAPGYVADDVPELAIATLPGHEGRGIGSGMLRDLLSRASGRYPAITLNARLDNPAVGLYRRFGFTAIGELTNRVGTRSVKMLLRYPATSNGTSCSAAVSAP